MNYNDIKGQVLRIDKTLELVPTQLLEELMADLQHIDLDSLLKVEMAGTYCIVHALMEDMFDYRMVCTVVMKGVAAFFFLVEGGESWDKYSYHILSRNSTMALIKHLIDTHLEGRYQDIKLTEIQVVDDIPELTSFFKVHRASSNQQVIT